MTAAVGQKFGRLTVTRVFLRTVRRLAVEAKCDCGKVVTAAARSVCGGNTQSCGCLQRQRASTAKVKHGMHGSPEYNSWMSAKGRCFNPKNKEFASYGARGISMSAAWRDDFAKFYSDMGPRPAGTTLDRRNNSGDYELGNCRWATPQEQAGNRRPARRAA